MPAIHVSDQVINYRVRHSHRARRGRILVSADGVEVVVPAGAASKRVAELVYARREWILERQAEFERRRRRAQPYCDGPLKSGSILLYRGSQVTLVIERAVLAPARAGVSLRGQRLHVFVSTRRMAAMESPIARIVERWMREQLRGRAETLMASHATRLCVNPQALRIKTQKQRWGSCGSTGIINLNWRLAMAPDTVVAYVIIHELCHLLERNHSRAFWQLVARECPDYRERKRWLEEHDLILSGSLQPT